jgi:hypothetical protein
MADLSGAWLGTFWHDGEPTRFEMTLVQGGNTLSGYILDDGPLGEATLSGEAVGRITRFTKRYLVSPSKAYSIQYEGQISEDGNLIQGNWTITAIDSGNWEAQRIGENLTLKLETRQEVPLAAGKK